MNNGRSSKMPIYFTIIGYLLNGSLIVYRLFRLQTLSEKVMLLVMCTVYILWSIWEIRISLAEINREAAQNDSMTLEFAGVIKNIMLAGGLALTHSISLTRWVIGMSLLFFGIVVRVLAIKYIGKNYSHRIREIIGDPVTAGPYSLIRHPSYAGTLIIHTGVVLILFNAVSFTNLILWYINAFYRITVEEQTLGKNKDYREYQKTTTYRLFPFLW